MSESLRKVVRKILQESIIVPPQIPGTMNFWHGGNLDEYDDVIAQKSGRYEYGPGLYIITKYEVASKYAKGSRKMYLITVEKGVDINDVFFNFDTAKEFVNQYVIKNKRKEVFERMEKFKKEDKIKGFIFNNILINEKAVKPINTQKLRQFYIYNGVDYEIIDNAFGWGEKMMVLYNMKKIVNVIQIKPGDKIEKYDL
jgi:hypothetical protein